MTRDDIDTLVKEMSNNWINIEYSTIVPQPLIDMVLRSDISLTDFLIAVRKLPRTKNPFYMPLREVNVLCSQGHGYIVNIPSLQPIPEITGLNKEVCPTCGDPIQNWKMLAGHSGGTFNAITYRSGKISL